MCISTCYVTCILYVCAVFHRFTILLSMECTIFLWYLKQTLLETMQKMLKKNYKKNKMLKKLIKKYTTVLVLHTKTTVWTMYNREQYSLCFYIKCICHNIHTIYIYYETVFVSNNLKNWWCVLSLSKVNIWSQNLLSVHVILCI